MLEAAEKTVSRSFLCLWFVVSQSVIVSRTACLFCWAECVVCAVVVCPIKITCPHCSLYFVIIIIIIMIIIIIIIIIIIFIRAHTYTSTHTQPHILST